MMLWNDSITNVSLIHFYWDVVSEICWLLCVDCHVSDDQLARHRKDLQQSLKPAPEPSIEGDDALTYFANHTAQIEVRHVSLFLSFSFMVFGHNMRQEVFFTFQIVRHDRTMEQIVFPVPNICEYLTEESKVRVFTTTERDDQGSKVNDFFQQFDDLYNEMRWQKKIRSEMVWFAQKSNQHNLESSLYWFHIDLLHWCIGVFCR